MNIYRGIEQYRNIDGVHTSDGFLIEVGTDCS